MSGWGKELGEQATRWQRLMRAMIVGSLFVATYEPMAIYRRPGSRSVFRRPEVRAPLGRLDAARDHWRPYLVVIIAYLVARCGLVGSLQLLATLDRAWPAAEQLLGNPLEPLSGVSSLFYFIIGFSLTAIFIVGPARFRHEPGDCLFVRYFIEPQRERTTVDLLVCNHLRALLEAVSPGTSADQKSLQANQHPAVTTVGRLHNLGFVPVPQMVAQPPARLHERQTHSQTRRQVSDLKRHRALLQQQLSRPASLRPSLYSQHCLNRLYWLVMVCALVSALVSLVGVAWVAMLLVGESTRMRCARMRLQGQCSLARVLSPRDSFAFWEFVVGVTLTKFTLDAQTVLLIVYYTCASELIRDARFQLTECARQLQRDPMRAQPDQRAELSLLRTLVRLQRCLEQLASMGDFLSKVAGCVYWICGVSLTSALLISTRVRQVRLREFVSGIALSSLLAANLALATCASRYAATTKLQRLGWSVLAAISERRAQHPANRSSVSVFELSWRRLVLSGSLASRRFAVRPFGVALTYKRLLELNFGVLSLVVILRTF